MKYYDLSKLFTERPLVPILLACITGIIFGRFFPPSILSYLIPFLIVVTLVVLFIPKGRSRQFAALILTTSVLFGQVMMIVPDLLRPRNHILYLYSDDKVSLEGRLYRPPEITTRKVRLYLDAERLYKDDMDEGYDVSGRVRITIYERGIQLQYGDKILVKRVRLHRPGSFKNPNAFDYEAYMADRGIYVTGGVSRNKRIEVIERAEHVDIFAFIYGIKKRMIDFIDSTLPDREASIMKGMVLGERGAIPGDIRRIFIESGIAHLLAVSGLHIGFIAFTIFYLLKRVIFYLLFYLFPGWARRGMTIKIAAFVTIFPVLFYSILVGDRISSVRATIMVIVYLLSILFDRENDLYNTLVIAALLILSWRPASIFDVGFQLSFTAVLSIIYIYSRFLRHKPEQDKDIPSGDKSMYLKRYRRLYKYILVSLFATLGTLPLIAYYFNRLTIYGFLVNLLVIPIASVVVPLSLISSIFSLISTPLAAILIKIPSILITFLLNIAKFSLTIPYSTIRLPTPPLIAVISYYIFMWGIINMSDRPVSRDPEKEKGWIKPVSILAGIIFVVSISWNWLPSFNDGLLRVTFLDVGQGECSFIRFPDGKTMLIDAGGLAMGFDIGEGVVASFLWDQGISKIDYMVATHPDNDHIGGLFSIVREMKVKEFWDSGEMKEDKRIVDLRMLVQKKGIPVRMVRAGMELQEGNDIQIKILHPSDDFWEGLRSGKKSMANNLSIVLKVNYGRVSFLFPGDVGRAAEKYLLLRYGDDLRSTIVKVPHHGSMTSSSYRFVKGVHPDVAVISVGKYNPFRHPRDKIVRRYEKIGTRIYRTDRDGAVQVITDGEDYSITTFP
ncbi:MAG: DNA internalization-related competence protein ComEC/Rec2 [Nitrospinota bacterium]